ncbi:MAG: hypothetical protein HYY37_05320 [Candidatus Aenigmarchaeota archaeon]|nr:hypothetical protein [Candidatus Aenigmarchaeota archaeon]
MDSNMVTMMALVVILVSGCVSQPAGQTKAYSPSLNPAEVVELYFASWDSKDYEMMYATISDGFKRIEPTAQTPEAFSAQMAKFYESAKSVQLVSDTETINDGATASIDYTIEIEKTDGMKTPFSGTYTLKYRSTDASPGWKLIHPYGKNVDIS